MSFPPDEDEKVSQCPIESRKKSSSTPIPGRPPDITIKFDHVHAITEIIAANLVDASIWARLVDNFVINSDELAQIKGELSSNRLHDAIRKTLDAWLGAQGGKATLQKLTQVFEAHNLRSLKDELEDWAKFETDSQWRVFGSPRDQNTPLLPLLPEVVVSGGMAATPKKIRRIHSTESTSTLSRTSAKQNFKLAFMDAELGKAPIVAPCWSCKLCAKFILYSCMLLFMSAVAVMVFIVLLQLGEIRSRAEHMNPGNGTPVTVVSVEEWSKFPIANQQWPSTVILTATEAKAEMVASYICQLLPAGVSDLTFADIDIVNCQPEYCSLSKTCTVDELGSQIEELKFMHQASIESSACIFEMLSAVSFPNLRRLEIQNLDIVGLNIDHLRSIIRKSKSTLKQLLVCGIKSSRNDGLALLTDAICTQLRRDFQILAPFNPSCQDNTVAGFSWNNFVDNIRSQPNCNFIWSGSNKNM